MLSPSLLLNHLESQSIKQSQTLLPILPVGIVAYAFTLLWDHLCRNSCKWNVGHAKDVRANCFCFSKTKSVTPHIFYVSDITNSSSFNGKIFRTKSMLENFRANVLKQAMNDEYLERPMIVSLLRYTELITNSSFRHFICLT